MKKGFKKFTTYALMFLLLFNFSKSVPGYQAAKTACYNAGVKAASSVKLNLDLSNIDFSKFDFSNIKLN